MKNGKYYHEARMIYHNLQVNDSVTTSKNVRNALYKYKDRQLRANGYKFKSKTRNRLVTITRTR